jgi:hypothetical protein
VKTILSHRSRTKRLSTDNINPMDGLRNLIDVMLVFAVGLLVALVISRNMQGSFFSKTNAQKQGQASQQAPQSTQNMQNIKNIKNIKKARELKDIPQIEKGGGSGYSEMGTVYRDAKTGKLILIETSGKSSEKKTNSD